MTGSPGLLSLCFHNFNSIERVEQKKDHQTTTNFYFLTPIWFVDNKEFFEGKHKFDWQKCDFSAS